MVDDPDDEAPSVSRKRAVRRHVDQSDHEQGEQQAYTVLPAANEHWVRSTWRPAMGWTYMVICIFDFILFPIGWTTVGAWLFPKAGLSAWVPITLSQGGLFHMAMGAVLGVAAWTRGSEKLSR